MPVPYQAQNLLGLPSVTVQMVGDQRTLVLVIAHWPLETAYRLTVAALIHHADHSIPQPAYHRHRFLVATNPLI